jgi:hypothetical protein
VTLSSSQLDCLLRGEAVLRPRLDGGVTYRAHVTTVPFCEVELAPERDGKGGGIFVRFDRDGGQEILRTK